MKKNNIQENMWIGQFGDSYSKRNIVTPEKVDDCKYIFKKIFSKVKTKEINRVLEVGCNLGRNLIALKKLLDCECFGVEPNRYAREKLKKLKNFKDQNIVDAFADNIPFENELFDLVFTSVVLIHIPNNKINNCLDEIFRLSKKYILTIEYFSPEYQEIIYRGEKKLLFKRDYGTLFMDRFKNLDLVDYGFFWKRVTTQDNVNWWLFKKKLK